MIRLSRFDSENAVKAHQNTILASAVLPDGVKAPFEHAWGCLEHPGEMETHRHAKEEIYFFFKGEGYVTVDGERVCVRCGDVVYIPSDALHNVGNEKDETLLWAALWWPAQK